MATPTRVATYSAKSLATTSLDVTGVQVGDWIVASQGIDYVDESILVQPSGAGAGTWNEIGSYAGNLASCNVKMKSWRKTATGTGTYTVTVVQTGNPDPSANHLFVEHLRGCSAVDGTPTVAQGVSGTAVALPSTSPSTADALLLAYWTGIQFTGTLAWAVSAPMTESGEQAQNQFAAMVGAYQVLSSSGATGTRTATASPDSSSGWCGKMFAISGVSAPPTVNAGPDLAMTVNALVPINAGEVDNGAVITARAWTIQSGPAGVGSTIGTDAQLMWYPTVSGTYVLRYSATNAGGVGTDDVTVVVGAGATADMWIYPLWLIRQNKR